MTPPPDDSPALLARLRAFCFPDGEEAARLVRAVHTTQRGEMRAAPNARWMPFTAEETIEAGRSSFRWEARYAGGSLAVTDAYEEGHGRLVLRLGGLVFTSTQAAPVFAPGPGDGASSALASRRLATHQLTSAPKTITFAIT